MFLYIQSTILRLLKCSPTDDWWFHFFFDKYSNILALKPEWWSPEHARMLRDETNTLLVDEKTSLLHTPHYSIRRRRLAVAARSTHSRRRVRANTFGFGGLATAKHSARASKDPSTFSSRSFFAALRITFHCAGREIKDRRGGKYAIMRKFWTRSPGPAWMGGQQ
jgi:hypothetical protein